MTAAVRLRGRSNRPGRASERCGIDAATNVEVVVMAANAARRPQRLACKSLKPGLQLALAPKYIAYALGMPSLAGMAAGIAGCITGLRIAAVP